MAENKKGFVLYADQKSIIDMLPNEVAGELFKHIFAYVNDEEPVSENPLVNLAFEPIKLQLKRDLKKWEDIKVKRSEAGKISAEKRKQQNQQVLTSVESVEQTSTNPTVKDNVNVKVNVINNNIVESIDFDQLLSFINSTFGRSFKVVNDKVKKKYKALFKQGYNKEQIKDAILNASKNDYHKQTNYQYCTLEFFSRPETIDKYSSLVTFDSSSLTIQEQIIKNYKA
jgi:uncharacterized phage protein (TIGR02220 family)